MNLYKSIGKIAAIGAYPFGVAMGAMRAGWNGNGHGYFRQFEGGERDRRRDRPPKILQSEDNALNLGAREELMSEARSLAMTYGIVRKILRSYSNYCVGSCRVKWDTGVPELDKVYQEAWKSWMNMADANGQKHFRTLTRIVVQSVLKDGDIFAQQCDVSGQPYMRLIEADRVSSSGIFNSDKFIPGQEQMYGGMIVDPNGTVRAVRVWKRGGFGTFRDPIEIPNSEIVHPFQADRADTYRGVTHFATALNAIRDLKETITAERLSAKRNSKLSLLIKTLTGSRIAGGGFDPFEPDMGAAGDKGGKLSVERVDDAVDAYMFPNEDIQAHASNRPSQGWLGLMEWLVREISIALDLPFGVVWNMAGLGGPAARVEINQANRTFGNFTEEVVERSWIIPVAGWVISKKIKNGELPFHANWYRYKPHRPASITIDLGRDSKAGISEIQFGLNTSSRWIAEDDQDFEEVIERLAQEEQFRQKMAVKYGIDPSTLRSSPTGGGSSQEEEPDPETPAPGEPDEPPVAPAPKPKKKNGNKNSSET